MVRHRRRHTPADDTIDVLLRVARVLVRQVELADLVAHVGDAVEEAPELVLNKLGVADGGAASEEASDGNDADLLARVRD